MLEAGLAVAVVVFFYPFVIYPLLLIAVTRPGAGYPPLGGGDLPSLAMVVCALNEERIIRQKIENTLSLDYPREKLRLIFVSDGSTDETASIIGRYAGRGVELIERKTRIGKIANLNRVLPEVKEDIILLSDANVIYDTMALRAIVAPFRDPAAGAVSGKVILTDTTEDLRSSEQQYYSLEWTLQERASSLYSMAGADGAMYAFRAELFRPCPPDTLIEDFVIPIGIVRQGKRVLFQPAALAWEQGPASLGEEFRRKVRIAAGAAQAILRGNGLPFGAPLRFWFIFLSHKLLRWLSPLSGLVVLFLAVLSSAWWFSRLLLAAFAGLALLAGLRAATGRRLPFLNAPFYFLFTQAALLTGLVKGVTGRQSVLWAKANR